MPVALPVSRLINVTITLSPLAAQFANLNSLNILGDSNVIDTGERIRQYGSLAAVAADFGTSAPEYLAASLYFSQAPQPNQLFISRWAQAATPGILKCGALSAAQKAMSNFTTFTAGKFKIQVDAAVSATEITCGTMAGAANLAAVATIINTALTTATAGATCAYDATRGRFVFTSATTGANSKVLPLTAGTTNDLSVVLNGTVALGASEVDGMAAETAVAAVTAIDQLATSWYGLMVASTHVVDADHSAIAAYIEGGGNSLHIYGVTTQNPDTIDPTKSTDIASVLSTAQYTRSFVQYSSTNAYAVASMFGRLLTTNFGANNSMITLMWKQEPGVTPETLTYSAAGAIDTKRANVFVNYNNNTAILEDGVMSGPAYIDERYGADWLANRIQTDVWNLFYTSPTKIPQTDAGNDLIAGTIEHTCAGGVTNGLLAEGVWTSQGFGQLKQGGLVAGGFYVYAPPIASQATADRAARKSVAFQVAAKLAGAIHTADISILVNR